jgi:hypothetical protein
MTTASMADLDRVDDSRNRAEEPEHVTRARSEALAVLASAADDPADRWSQGWELEHAASLRTGAYDAEVERLKAQVDEAATAALKAIYPDREDDDVDRRRITLVPASSIKPRPVRWLWDRRIALGTLALLGGREGIGKSMVAYQLTADITRGRLAGVNLGRPRAVVVCATEDSWEHTIVPRLMAADADLDRVYRIDVVTSEGLNGTLTLPIDLELLENAVRDVEAALIVLDPLLSRLSTALDTHKDAEVRIALEPVTAVADRTGSSVVGLIHVNKGTTVDPLTMLMGSRAFAAVARSVLFVAVDPEDETGKLRYLGQPKNNLGDGDLPSLTFTIEAVKVADHDDGPVITGRVEWRGEDDRSITDVLRSAATPSADQTATTDAAGWLVDYLKLVEVAASEDVLTEGKKYGHAKRTVQRARERIRAGVTSHGFPRRTYWSRPGMEPDDVVAWLDASGASGANAAQSCQSPGETQQLGMTVLFNPPEAKEDKGRASCANPLGATGGMAPPQAPVAPVAPSPSVPTRDGATAPGATDR